MAIEELYKLYLQYPSVQTDTRKLKKNDIFFALSGPKFNGNLFAAAALEAGASYAVVDEDIDLKDERLIRVNDVLQMLQDLAKHHREQFDIPFIAITGSNGKTTTKELVNAVLSSHYTCYTTEGNLNNHIGIPLTLLRVHSNAQVAVIEMGANHQKEIEGYCKYVQPTHGIITNCGKAHLEGFGGFEGVKKAKGELFDYLRENNGTAFIYSDYDYLQTMSRGIENIVTYGTNDANVKGKSLPGGLFLEMEITTPAFTDVYITHLVGEYNLPNVLCSVAVGRYFNVPDAKIRHAVETYLPNNSRSQMVHMDSNKIILDAYNANPTSTKAAIENFAKVAADKKIIMLGAMAELGPESIEEHKEIVNLVSSHSWSSVVLVGGDFEKVAHPFIYFKTSAEAGKWYREQQFKNAYLLIKGSRSMQMEKILEAGF